MRRGPPAGKPNIETVDTQETRQIDDSEVNDPGFARHFRIGCESICVLENLEKRKSGDYERETADNAECNLVAGQHASHCKHKDGSCKNRPGGMEQCSEPQFLSRLIRSLRPTECRRHTGEACKAERQFGEE